ncbi:MAG: hypothetical protein ITG01_07090 [Comamonas sp.]|nr:hypothetical protein [Comamonas sp.]
MAALEKAEPCSSRQAAFELVHSTWLEVNSASIIPDQGIDAFRNMQICAEDGWQNLDGDPCFLTSIEHTGLGLYLHNNGTFVIQDLSCASCQILIAKLGVRQALSPAGFHLFAV